MASSLSRLLYRDSDGMECYIHSFYLSIYANHSSKPKRVGWELKHVYFSSFLDI